MRNHQTRDSTPSPVMVPQPTSWRQSGNRCTVAEGTPIIGTNVRLSDFHYLLPSERIAQEPLADRSAARMLHLLRDGRYEDRTFRELPEILQPDDLMVFNNTKVFPARLFGSRSGR